MASAQQARLFTAFYYLNDNFYCENSPVHQIEVSLPLQLVALNLKVFSRLIQMS